MSGCSDLDNSATYWTHSAQDNDIKCFLSSKSAYYDFWRIMWH